MKNKMINTIMFITGAALGSLVTWKYVKTKYERIAQEEIDSVKDAFFNDKCASKNDELKNIEPNEAEDVETDLLTDAEMLDYRDITARYTSSAAGSTNKNEQKGGGMSVNVEKPYIISPDDFGELDGYDTATLTYYADGVLEDDYYLVIEESEVDAMVGIDSFNHFGEHEKDTVFVRNEKLKTDFEIQRDLRKYSEIFHESLQNGS